MTDSVGYYGDVLLVLYKSAVSLCWSLW